MTDETSAALFEERDGKVVVPPGRYAVGDLCYSTGRVHEAWRAYLDGAHRVDEDTRRGIIQGRPSADFHTAHGDGSYDDQEGREYPVDSGNIGITAWPEGSAPSGMHLIETTQESLCYVEDSVIVLGTIKIDTDPLYEEDDEDDNEDDADVSPRP